MTRLALARVRCGSGVSGGGVGGVDLHRVKAVRAVAMLNHEHSVHSPTDVVARRGDYQTHNPRARCQISCAARGCRLPELHGRSCFVPAELSNYQDWRCARCRADEPGSWRSCPLGSLCTFDSPRNPKCTRRRRKDATDACEAGWPPAAGARHVRSEALSTDHVLDSVGVAGFLKLDHRRWHWQ